VRFEITVKLQTKYSLYKYTVNRKKVPLCFRL